MSQAGDQWTPDPVSGFVAPPGVGPHLHVPNDLQDVPALATVDGLSDDMLVAETKLAAIHTDAYVNWSPVLTQGATPGQTVEFARYTRVGRTIHAYGYITLTGAGTAGQSILITQLPFTMRASSLAMCTFRYFDTGNTNYVGAGVGTSGTALALYYQGDGNPLGTTQPTTANGDFIQFMVIYEASS